MTSDKNNEFHQPFLDSLVFIALLTLVSMISVRFYVSTLLLSPSKTIEITSQHSQE